MEIIAVPGTISETQVQEAQRFFTQELAQPVELTVRVIPVEEFVIPASP